MPGIHCIACLPHVRRTAQYKLGAKPTTNMLYHDIGFTFVEKPNYIAVGVMANAFAVVWAAIGTVILTYISDTPLEIILNSVALFFLVDLDDALVDRYDYQRNARTFRTALQTFEDGGDPPVRKLEWSSYRCLKRLFKSAQFMLGLSMSSADSWDRSGFLFASERRFLKRLQRRPMNS